MVMHTIVPLNLVIENYDKPRNIKQIELKGVTCEVEVIDETSARLVRVISTDPQAYLNSEWQPGTIITFAPKT